MTLIVLLYLCAACNGDAKGGSAAQSEAAVSAGSTGFDGNAAYNYAKAQVDFGPRVPGTPAAKQAGDWIIRQMRARADTVIVQSFTYTTADGKKLPLRNILARIPARAAGARSLRDALGYAPCIRFGHIRGREKNADAWRE